MTVGGFYIFDLYLTKIEIYDRMKKMKRITLIRKENFEMKKIVNTVPAENQMIKSSETSFLGDPNAPLKILILGNSITRHGPAEAIGWHGDWGMAASAPEKDYVHRLHKMLTENGVDSYMMVRQAAYWERNFKDTKCLLEYEEEKAFGANIVIFRLCENVCKEDFDDLKEAAKAFVSYVAPEGATVIVTTSFWKSSRLDSALREAAQDLGGICVDIGYTNDSMMAIGKFEHHGVSIHPGDEGMEMIAKKIFEALS